MDANVILGTIWEYVIIAVPAILAIIGEVVINKLTTKTIGDLKETKEIKEVIEQNRKLQREIREQNKLTRELLTKIDRIQRTEPPIEED